MNILLTSVGRRAYLVKYFKEALANKGKVHVSNSTYSISMDYSDEYLITPLIYNENYIPTLINYCVKKNISAIISLFDIDLLVLAKNEKVFEKNGIKLILAPESSVRICNDKWSTYQFLLENKINTPLTFLSIEETILSLKNKKVSYPLMIKPRWGMASLSIYKVDNENELKVLYNKAKNEIFESYLKYESEITKNSPLIIQEFLNGDEFGLDVVNDLDSNYVTTFAKQKIAMRAGETDIGKIVSADQFNGISTYLSEKLKHKGILSVDCIDSNNQLYVIEMNCRISGHYPLSHLGGADIPKQIIKWLSNEETDYNLLKVKKNLLITKELIPKIISK